MLIAHRKKPTEETTIKRGLAFFGLKIITSLNLQAYAETVFFRQPYTSAQFHLWAYAKINSLVGIIPCVCRPFHKHSCVCIKPFVRELGAYGNTDEMP